MTEPKNFTAGDTVKWTKSVADYPASAGWALSYAFINAAAKFTASGVANGADFDVTISATTSASITAGDYYWEAYVTKASERFKVGSGTVKVKPNLATATTLDARSHAKKTLDAIEAVIEGRATVDQQEYQIGNRSLKRMPIADLIVFAEKYRAMVRAEENAEAIAQGKTGKNKLYVRL